jgi:cadmium resistance protein CadD (predicted permease)
MTGQGPLWDYPDDVQPRCQVVAGCAWIFLGFVYLTSGFPEVVATFWAVPAIMTSYFMVRWLWRKRRQRLWAVALLGSCTLYEVLLILSIVSWIPSPRADAHWLGLLPIMLSLWGAVLGLIGRGAEPNAAA